MAWRSKDILERPEWSMHRALWKSMGYSDYDLAQPLIGIANSWNRVVPGHYNLDLVSDYVKQGILQAGGTPSSSASWPLVMESLRDMTACTTSYPAAISSPTTSR